MKLLLQIAATFFLCIWPMVFMTSPMMIGGPGAADRLGNVLTIILVLAYPLPIGALFYYLDWRLLGMPPKTVLIVTSLAASVGVAVYGFMLFNIVRGVSNSGYSVTANAVYYGGSKIKDADPKTFQRMSEDEYYAKDKSHVYRVGIALPGVDAATFRFLGSGSAYARDERHVYYAEDLVAGADAATFEPLMFAGAQTGYWRDRNHVYTSGKPIPTADSATFEPLSEQHLFGRDKNHVYDGNEIIDGADAASFVLLNYRIGKDKGRIYRGKEAILPTANAAQFRLIDRSWAVDDQRVYFIPDAGAAIALDRADPGSFVILDPRYAKDASTVYHSYGNELTPVVDADAGTFVVLDWRADAPDAKDSRREYRNGKVFVPPSENSTK